MSFRKELQNYKDGSGLEFSKFHLQHVGFCHSGQSLNFLIITLLCSLRNKPNLKTNQTTPIKRIPLISSKVGFDCSSSL